MKILTNQVARILYSLPLLMFGMGHFTNATTMAEQMIPNLPGNTILVYLTGAALFAAAISIILKKMAGLSTLLLAVMLLSFAFIIHLPNMMSTDEMMSMMGTANFFKDIGLAGAALFMSGVFRNEKNS